MIVLKDIKNIWTNKDNLKKISISICQLQTLKELSLKSSISSEVKSKPIFSKKSNLMIFITEININKFKIISSMKLKASILRTNQKILTLHTQAYLKSKKD